MPCLYKKLLFILLPIVCKHSRGGARPRPQAIALTRRAAASAAPTKNVMIYNLFWTDVPAGGR